MKKRRILIIDDEERFTRLLKLNLEESGPYEVRVENEGSRAYDTAKEFKPDLILLDIVIPDTDTDELYHRLKNDPTIKDAPVVFVTALASKGEAAKRGGKIGQIPFLAKPINVQDVINCIEENLTKVRA